MHLSDSRDILIRKGSELFQAKKTFVSFTKKEEANTLLNDLDAYPHAFLIACLMDRQMLAERAWVIPYELSKKLGSFNFSVLEGLNISEIERLMVGLHRLPKVMSGILHQAIARIATSYQGNAAKIWNDNPSSAEVVYRFLQFDGAGPKIATMAANSLARDFKIPFKDYYSIDISVDVHIRRVFQRLGFITKDASTEEVIYKARALHPKFPGLMDLPTWEIGRTWCKSQNPKCDECYMKSCCQWARKASALVAPRLVAE